MTEDEDVWLRGYCAAIAGGHDDEQFALIADKTLKDFKARFPNTDKDLPDFLKEQA